MMVIYRAENLITGKSYIGQTVNCLKKRMKDHLRAAFKEGNKNPFYCSLRKYGENNFKFSVIDDEVLFESELNGRERFYIKKFNSKFPNGYNLAEGGQGPTGYVPTAESNKRRSDAVKEEKNYQWKGGNVVVICKNKACEKPFTKRPYHTKEYCCKACMYSDPERSLNLSNKNKGKRRKIPEGYVAWNKGQTKETNKILWNRSEKLKGMTPWNKGLTKETDKRVAHISEQLKNSTAKGAWKKGQIPWNLGISTVHSEESNIKRSLALKGKKKSEETVKKMKLAWQLRKDKNKSGRI